MTDADSDTRGQELREHDFRRAQLKGADFTGSDLERADFGEADLEEADFAGAMLTGARLRKANLEGAQIENAVLIEADLFEAKAKSFEKTLELRRDELRARSGSLRTIVLAALSFLIYTAISIFTSKDEVVLSNSGMMEVPVLDAKVSPHAFFVSSCVVGFGLVTYIQLQLVAFAALLARVPARFPDGYRLHLGDLVDSWVLSLLGFTPVEFGSHAGSRWLARFGRAAPTLLLRWTLPATIALTGWRLVAAASRVHLAVLTALLLASLVVNWAVPNQIDVMLRRPQAPWRWRTAVAAAAMLALTGIRPTLWRTFGPYWPDGLQFAALDGATLADTNFSDTNFFGAHLVKANLYRANLNRAYLNDANLTQADLRRATLQEAYAPESTFDKANLQGADLRRTTAHRGSFKGATLYGANLSGARLQNADLSEATLESAYLLGVQAAWASFDDVRAPDAKVLFSDLSGASLKSFKGWRTDFSDSNLSGAQLTDATLTDGVLLARVQAVRTNFDGARLTNAVVTDGTFDDATFVHSGLWQATFTNVSLVHVRFEKADAPNLTVTGGTLTHASFAGATLYYARFDDVDVTNANFAEAKLGHAVFGRGVRGVTRAQLRAMAEPPRVECLISEATP